MSDLQFTKFHNVKILSSVFLLQCLWILSNMKFSCAFMVESTSWILGLVINGFANKNNFWNSIFGWTSGFICCCCILCRLQVVSRWSKLFPIPPVLLDREEVEEWYQPEKKGRVEKKVVLVSSLFLTILATGEIIHSLNGYSLAHGGNWCVLSLLLRQGMSFSPTCPAEEGDWESGWVGVWQSVKVYPSKLSNFSFNIW